MKNKFFKFTSVVLSCLLLISQNVTLAEGIFDSQTSDIPQPTSDVKVLGEVESRRSEYTKHFRMSDGTMQAMIYPTDLVSGLSGNMVYAHRSGSALSVRRKSAEGPGRQDSLPGISLRTPALLQGFLLERR